MHLGIFAKTFPRPTLEATLDAIARHGITHVQFNMSCAGLPTLPERLDEDLCVWIARSFRERGLTMAAISGTSNLCDPDHPRLIDNLRRLEVIASACRWLDTRIITLCTGTRDPEDMWRWHPENVRRGTWEALVRAMRLALEIADRHEVTLAFEPERNNVVNSVPRARMLLDEIGSPWLKVVIDPANLMEADDRPRLPEILDEAFDWLGPHIVLAHAKNPPYAGIGEELDAILQWQERDDPGISALREALHRTGSCDPLSLSKILELMKEIRSLAHLEPAGPLQEFYQAYTGELRRREYAGALILHGLGEESVAIVKTLLLALLGPSRSLE